MTAIFPSSATERERRDRRGLPNLEETQKNLRLVSRNRRILTIEVPGRRRGLNELSTGDRLAGRWVVEF
jgi:hypothetical protein